MADGRKIPYIIEMGINDEKLKRQMSQWDWEEIIGVKEFGKHFKKPAKEASNAIEHAFASTEIDWEKALQTDAFKKGVTKIVQHANAELREGLLGKDEAKQVTEFIAEIGNAWKEVGVVMDAKGFARSMAAFAKSVEPLVGQIDRLVASFEKVFNSIGFDIASAIDSKGIISNAEKTIEGVGDVVVKRVHNVSKAIQRENNKATKFLSELNRKNVQESKLGTIEDVEKKLRSLYRSYEFNYSKSADAEAAKNAKEILDTIEYAEKRFETFSGKRIFKEDNLREMKSVLDEQVAAARQAQEKYKDEVEKAFQLDLADKLTENLKNLNLKIALPKDADFTKQVNDLIKRVNKKRLEKIKTTIDVTNELNPKTKKEREELNTKEVGVIERKFAAIDNAIDSKQQSILEKTRAWRKDMQDAIVQGGTNSISFGFKWDSANIEDIASDIFADLQEFFAQEDHKIAIRIDEEALFNSIKGALGDKALAIGGSGGNVNIDPTSIAEAVKAGVLSAVFGKDININAPQKFSERQNASEKKNDTIPDTPKHHIDVNKSYTTHLIDVLKDIAKSATKENKEGKLNQKQNDVLSFFASKGINLKDLGDTDEDVAKILERALFTVDEQGKIRSSDLVDAIQNFQTSRKVQWKSLDEFMHAIRILLTSFGEEGEYEDSKTLDKQSHDIIKDASNKAKGVKGLRSIKRYYSRSNNQYNERNLPDVDNINKIIELSSEMETDGLLASQLDILKKAREELGDKRDEESIAKFQAVYQEVWSKIETRFNDLVNYLEAFSGELDIKGRKNPVKFSNKTRESKSRIVGTLASLKDDVVIEHAEIYTSPNDQSIGMGIKSPKTGRVSQGQERSLLRGSKTDYTVRQSHEDDLAIRNRAYQEEPDYIKQARKYEKETLKDIDSQAELSVIAKDLIAKIESAGQGTKKAIESQLKLQKVLDRSGQLYKESSGKKKYEISDIGELLGIGDKVELRLSEASAMALDVAATSYFKKGNIAQSLGLTTNRVGTSDKTVEDYNNSIKEAEERYKTETEAAALSEQFRQDVKKILGNEKEYVNSINSRTITKYSEELENQREKIIANQAEQEKLNSSLAQGAEWLEKVWPREMEEAQKSGDVNKQQELLSRRESVSASLVRMEENRDAVVAAGNVLKSDFDSLVDLATQEIRNPISKVVGETVASLQKLGVEYEQVEKGTAEEYAIIGRAQDLLKALNSAEDEANNVAKQLEKYGISLGALLTDSEKEIVDLAKNTFVTSQSGSKQNIRRDVISRSSNNAISISNEIEALKNERDELINQKEQEYLRQLIENSKLSGDVLEGLRAESDTRSKKFNELSTLGQVQSNLSLAYQKRSDASSRMNYAEEQKGKLDRFGLSAKGTYANDVLNERKRAHANEFFSSDWYYGEIQRIRNETAEEMKAVEEQIVQKHKKWKQVVDKTKQEVLKEVASESVDLEKIRTSAEEDFAQSKKYKNITKSQERKKQNKLAEIQAKIDAEVAEMIEESMAYQSEAIDAEAKTIASSHGRNIASEKDIEQATSRVKANIEKLSRDRVNAKYASDIELVDSEMRMYLENAIVQAGERAVQQAIEDVIKGKGKEVGRRIYEAINAREEKLRANSKFQGMTGNLLTDYDKAQQSVYARRKQETKNLSKSYYDNLISEDGILSIPQYQDEKLVADYNERIAKSQERQVELKTKIFNLTNKISSATDVEKVSLEAEKQQLQTELASEIERESTLKRDRIDKTWVVTTEDVRAIVDARLDTMLSDAKSDKGDAQENVDKYSAMKNEIISENGFTEEEVFNRELIKKMLLEQERQSQYQEDIDLLNKVLKDEGLTDEQRKDLKAKIRELETNLQNSKLTVEALQTRRETAWSQKTTPTSTNEEKIAKNEERIASYNESIEKSQNKQIQLRTQIAELAEKAEAATDEEKKNIQEQQATLQSKLEDEKKKEEALKRDRARRKQENERLRETPVSESIAKKEDPSLVSILANAIKEAIGGKGGLGDTSGIATEDTLKQILAILSGNGSVGVARNPEMDAKLARIKELETKQQLANEQKKTAETKKQAENAKKETTTSSNVADSKANVSKTQVYKDIQKSVDAFRTSELKADKEPLNAIKIALDELSKINDQNSQEYIEWQRKLGSALAAYGKKNGIENGKGYYEKVYTELAKNGIAVDPKLAITNKSGISNALVEKGLVSIKEKEAKAKQSEAKAEEKITEEHKKQEQIRFTKKEKRELNRLKNETKDYNPQVSQSNETASKGFGSLAREDTLSKILEVLNTFKSEGVKTTGKAKDEADEKTPKKTEAELIKERALRDKDAVLGIASDGSRLKKKYIDLMHLLEAATEIGDIKKYAQKVSALGFNIKKEAAEWDYKVGSIDNSAKTRVYDIPNANTFGKRRDTVRKSMEKLAQGKFNPDGKQYEFLNFDGKNLSYQLTDIHGNVEKVTMSWSELNNQVAITSDKSVAKLDTLANKVAIFEDKFKNAIDSGYLGAKDRDLKKFQDAVIKVNDEIANGASFETIEKLRNEALRLADIVDKKTAKNKRAYSGTTEINAVERQRGNIGILDQENVTLVKEYNASYDALMKKFNKFKANGTLFNPKNQKTLQDMALHTKALGKELEKAANNSERLRQAINNSGTINGQSIGAEFKVDDPTQVYDQMVAKLKELGAEHIKVDRVRKIATGTIRHNNTTVSDLTVEYDKLRGSLARYQKQERESLTGLPAFINGFQKKFNSIMQYLTMTMSIHQVLAQLRRGVQYIKEIDLALTELRKVTDKTEEEYDKFLQTAAKTGERLGATISAVTEATATFAKLGYTMEQATEMAEAAIVYKNVGDNIASTEDAADSIISTMKGFGLEATESMAIVDKFNEVGNRFAITSQGIGEALRLSASALNEGKNSLDESIALITAANEVVNDPSSVGTALKTLTLRLRGSKTELEEMGEDVTDMATTTSQLQAKLLALTGGQVDIMASPTEFKNTTQILREMAGAWEDMNDIQRASALELMGGRLLPQCIEICA